MGVSVTMALFWITLIISVIGSHAHGGELAIISSTKGLEFEGSQELPTSILKELYTAALGMRVAPQSKWKGIYIKNPFALPEVIVEVHVEGISSLGDLSQGIARYPLIIDEQPLSFESLTYRIKQRFLQNGYYVQSDFSNLPKAAYTMFGQIVSQDLGDFSNLDHNVHVDREFLYEIDIVREFTKKLLTKTLPPRYTMDLYFLTFKSLRNLLSSYGENSRKYDSAKSLLKYALSELSRGFHNTYGHDLILITVRTTDYIPPHEKDGTGRRVIRAATADPHDDEKIQNDNYSADYAAIFNIILWFGIVFAFALIAVVYAIMDMDPGRDSIIYRMTNTRMKKDN